MHKIKVGVLRGGPSSEYDVSLQTGGTVLRNLDGEKYVPYDILITKNGAWHLNGKEIFPEKVFDVVDVVFNALHGSYGEDGRVQKLCETFSMPYTGSRSFPSALCMNKMLTKDALKQHNIKMPQHLIIDTLDGIESRAFDIFRSFPQPTVIKPVSGGSSVGVTIAKNHDDIIEGVTYALKYSPQVLIEEYINGKEATVGVVEKFRGEDLYGMIPIEIIPAQGNEFFDYNAKYRGESEERCPGHFTQNQKDELQRLATLVHTELGLSHYSRSDFIVTPRRIYFLEVNTLPGLTEQSLVPKSLEAAGCSKEEFFDHLISLAIERK